MNRHTPGPWRTRDGVFVNDENKKHIGTVDIMAGDIWVGDFKPYGGDFPDYKTCKANAKLASLAPEMYELLYSLSKYEAGDQFPDPSVIHELLNRLK